MWMQLMLVSSGLLLIGATSDDLFDGLDFDLFLNLSPFKNFRKCNHENGKKARCVKKSSCSLEEPPFDHSTRFNFRESTAGCNIHFQSCCPEAYISLLKTSVVKPVGCGYSNPGAYVLDGLESFNGYADFGEFPWNVALMKKNVSDTKFHDAYIGGGILIDASVVLTVAHKVDEISASNLKVRAGEWDTGSIEEDYPHQERDVKKIIIHEEYLRLTLHYDFALIILEQPFDLDNAPHIGVACLERSLPPPGTQCYSMGWGEDLRTATHNYSEIIKKVELPLLDGNKCQNEYQNKLGQTYSLHKTLTCAGGVPNVDTCLGDGGFSLVCPIPDNGLERYSVVGMVVYGLGCGIDAPGVYAKVPEVYDWVETKMISEGFTALPSYRPVIQIR